MKQLNHMRFGLSEKQVTLIVDILRKEGVAKSVIFGSRAKGNFRHNSDIDIAVWGNDLNIGKILDELDELPMPYKIDVVDYHRISSAELREHIDRVGVMILTSPDEQTKNMQQGFEQIERGEYSTAEEYMKKRGLKL